MGSKKNRRDENRNALRNNGLRATPARVAILTALEDYKVPITHQELTEKLDSLGLDKSTIFRALQDLTEARLLRRLELGDHVWRYELAKHSAEHDAQLHPHLLCVDCGNIRCLNDAEVKVQLSPELGEVVDVLIKGHCQTCLTSQSSS